MHHLIIYFTFIFQYSTDKITNAFIANANLALLLITGHYKKKWREVNWTLDTYNIFGEKLQGLQGVTVCTSIYTGVKACVDL